VSNYRATCLSATIALLAIAAVGCGSNNPGTPNNPRGNNEESATIMFITQDPQANNRLHEASRRGDLYGVRRALADGADPASRTGPWGENALHLAAKGDYYEVILWLLDNTDLDVDTPDERFGSSALHKAAMLGNQNAAEVLVRRGSSVTMMNNDGFTPITIAERQGLPRMANHLREEARRAESRARAVAAP